VKKRFIGPANPGPGRVDLGHEVNVRGRYIGNVKPGEVIEVPDELCAATADDPAPVWPAELWEDVSDAPTAKPAARKKSGSEGE
jgi:hypothetical protein